ncbi:MAG: hypothetical protein PHW13_11550 [Methylococcales bacterium]|nr:hypothetical protein [Methylococcales bacterium]
MNNFKTVSQFRLDFMLALLFGLAGFGLYAYFALQLAETVYDDYLNLAFDFDPAYFLRFLTDKQAADGMGINYKHPFWPVFRQFAALFQAMGYDPKSASGLVMALFGGMTVTLSYVFARLFGAGRPESSAATLFFAAGSTGIFTSVIVESYGWVNFSLALLWCVYLINFRKFSFGVWPRLLAATLVFGVTITNIMQAVVAEFFLKCRTVNAGRAFIRAILFSLAVGLLAVFVVALFQPHDLWLALSDPLKTLRTIYWLKTKGETVGFIQLLKTFFIYSVYAPEFDSVRLSPTVDMLDFRAFRFSFPVLCAVWVWCGFWLANLIFGIRTKDGSKLILSLLATIILNLVFHLGYQFRGSIYIYAAHLYFPIFAVSLAAAPWVRTRGLGWRSGYTALFLILALFALQNNLLRSRQFIDYFKTIAIPADGDPAISVSKQTDMR